MELYSISRLCRSHSCLYSFYVVVQYCSVVFEVKPLSITTGCDDGRWLWFSIVKIFIQGENAMHLQQSKGCDSKPLSLPFSYSVSLFCIFGSRNRVVRLLKASGKSLLLHKTVFPHQHFCFYAAVYFQPSTCESVCECAGVCMCDGVCACKNVYFGFIGCLIMKQSKIDP